MTDYQAPTRDVEFILRHHLGDDSRDLTAFAALDDELIGAILEEAGRFAEQGLAPLYQSGDREGCRLDNGQVRTPAGWSDAYRQFAESGWAGLCLPESIGGQALPKVLALPIMEFWQGANLAFSMIQPLTEGAVEALEAAGAHDLMDRYGPGLATGEWTATMALTEAGAGSDLGQLKTSAQPDPDGGYRLSGDKLYISYGHHDFSERILHLVLGRLPDAPAGSRGISLFAVPSHLADGTPNAITCTGIEEKLGLHGSPTCSLNFDGAWCEQIGDAHKGLAIMFVMMNDARLSVGMQGVAVAERAYQGALAWAKERRQGRSVHTGDGPVPLIEHPDVQRLLMRQRSQILAARLLGITLAMRLDQARQADHPQQAEAEQEVALLTPVFKAWSSETACALTADAIQVFGGMGFIEETGVAQCYRDLKISTIYEGTTGIQAQDFMLRKVVRDQGQALLAWLDRVATDLGTLEALPHGAGQAVTLQTVLKAYRTQMTDTINLHGDDPAHLQAISVAALEATGILAGAWQLARAVVAAESDQVDASYRQNLNALLVFYNQHWLPLVSTHLARMTGDTSGLAAYDFTD